MRVDVSGQIGFIEIHEIADNGFWSKNKLLNESVGQTASVEAKGWSIFQVEILCQDRECGEKMASIKGQKIRLNKGDGELQRRN